MPSRSRAALRTLRVSCKKNCRNTSAKVRRRRFPQSIHPLGVFSTPPQHSALIAASTTGPLLITARKRLVEAGVCAQQGRSLSSPSRRAPRGNHRPATTLCGHHRAAVKATKHLTPLAVSLRAGLRALLTRPTSVYRSAAEGHPHPRPRHHRLTTPCCFQRTKSHWPATALAAAKAQAMESWLPLALRAWSLPLPAQR
jgi:hypothetical protein